VSLRTPCSSFAAVVLQLRFCCRRFVLAAADAAAAPQAVHKQPAQQKQNVCADRQANDARARRERPNEDSYFS